MKPPILPTLVLLFSLFHSLPAQEEGEAWHGDYATGVAEATEEGKDILLVFTGTDWIDISRRFYDEILRRPDFIDPVSEEFVLVKLEYPKDDKQPRQESARKRVLRDAYRVRGFPTVVLTDSEGRPFGFNGYQPVSPGEYAEMTMKMHAAREEGLAAAKEAADLSGAEKADKLSAGIPELPGSLAARFYREEMEAVVEADPDETLERTRTYRKMMADVDYGDEMQRLEQDVRWGEMIELTERFIDENELEGPALQKALLIKAGVQEKQGNTAGVIQTLLEIVKIDPETAFATDAQKQLDGFRAERLEEDLVP
ncbi:MAG: thioredoxin family protein [Verrucomicrobiales bacterium]